MNELLEKVYVGANEDDSVTVIVPAPSCKMSKKDWLSLHGLDTADEMIELYSIEFPASRAKRRSWQIEDDKLIIGCDKLRSNNLME